MLLSLYSHKASYIGSKCCLINNFIVVPSTPLNVEVIALYDESINLKEIIVHWNEIDNVSFSPIEWALSHT